MSRPCDEVFPETGADKNLLNAFVIESARLDAAHVGASYVSLAAALVNTRTGEVTGSCAGAEPPLIVARDTGEAREAGALGPLMGAVAGARYEEAHATLGAGDLFVIATDGITEARRRAPVPKGTNPFFGPSGLAVEVSEARHLLSLARVREALAQAARGRSGGQQKDDVCLLLCRRKG